MTRPEMTSKPERVATVRWAASMGAITAEALAYRLGTTSASARSRLSAIVREQLLLHQRPLAGAPALYSATPTGLRMSGLQGVDRCRVSASNSLHLIACAEVAAVLERCYPDHAVQGERELRRDERDLGTRLASAALGVGPDGGPLLHRPDLVIWPPAARGGLPVAVEVELTVKAPRRLRGICRAWARSRRVAGVLYVAAPAVDRPLERAIEQAHAGERVFVLPLDSLSLSGEPIGSAEPA